MAKTGRNLFLPGWFKPWFNHGLTMARILLMCAADDLIGIQQW